MPTIQQMVDHFLNPKRSDAPPWSDNTRHAYGTALSKFLSFLSTHKEIRSDCPTLLLGTDPDVLLDYADWLLRKAKPTGGKGFSENTYQLYLTTARTFYLHLFAEDHLGPVTATALQQMLVKFDKKRKIPWKQKTVSLRRETKRHGPPQELVDRLLRIVDGEEPPPDMQEKDRERFELRRLRNVALIHTLHATGARINEALGLTPGELLDDRMAVIRKEVSKGDAEDRIVRFYRQAWRALKAYLRHSGHRGSDSPIFLRHDRGSGEQELKQLSPPGAQAELRRLKALLIEDLQTEVVRLLLPDCTPEALPAWLVSFEPAPRDLPVELHEALEGVPEEVRQEVESLQELLGHAANLSAHCFRHGLGSRMLEETGDLAAVQDLLGHASPETTRRYAKLSHKHLKKVYDSVFD
jgi:site-specific recombinase XerD